MLVDCDARRLFLLVDFDAFRLWCCLTFFGGWQTLMLWDFDGVWLFLVSDFDAVRLWWCLTFFGGRLWCCETLMLWDFDAVRLWCRETLMLWDFDALKLLCSEKHWVLLVLYLFWCSFGSVGLSTSGVNLYRFITHARCLARPFFRHCFGCGTTSTDECRSLVLWIMDVVQESWDRLPGSMSTRSMSPLSETLNTSLRGSRTTGPGPWTSGPGPRNGWKPPLKPRYMWGYFSTNCTCGPGLLQLMDHIRTTWGPHEDHMRTTSGPWSWTTGPWGSETQSPAAGSHSVRLWCCETLILLRLLCSETLMLWDFDAVRLWCCETLMLWEFDALRLWWFYTLMLFDFCCSETLFPLHFDALRLWCFYTFDALRLWCSETFKLCQCHHVQCFTVLKRAMGCLLIAFWWIPIMRVTEPSSTHWLLAARSAEIIGGAISWFLMWWLLLKKASSCCCSEWSRLMFTGNNGCHGHFWFFLSVAYG